MLKINIKLIYRVGCGKRGDNIGDRHRINQKTPQEFLDNVNMLPDKTRTAILNDYLCKKCQMRAKRQIE